jgi:hypothetical protein
MLHRSINQQVTMNLIVKSDKTLNGKGKLLKVIPLGTFQAF